MVITDSNTTLLMHMDNSSFTDIYKHTIINDGAILDTSIHKFGTGSLNLGFNKYLEVQKNTDIDVSSGKFTIDFWFYQTSRNSYAVPFSLGKALSGLGESQLYVEMGSSGHHLQVINSSGTGFGLSLSLGTLPTLNVWHHFAIVKDSSNFYVFRDGIMIASSAYSSAMRSLGNNIILGCLGYDTSNNCFTGNIDEFRIVKGTAVWTTNFTPPTSEYSTAKFLIQDGDSIKGTTDGSNLVDYYSLPYTQSMFETSGMNDLSSITPAVIQKIVNDKFKISMFK